MKQQIKIKTLNIENDEIQFQIDLTNGINSTKIDFYGHTDEFINFANQLISFPKNIDSDVKYELGEKGENWAYFIFLRVFCYQANGDSAIQIKIDNNKQEPYKNESEFYILTVPASVNKLGKKLKYWNPKKETEIKWTAE